MQQLDFLPQEKVIWGRQILSDAIAALGRDGIERPILFTVEPLAALAHELVSAIGSDFAGEYLDFPPHVPDDAVTNALRACEGTGAKSIIALGGGSVLDAAKAVSHFYQLKHGSYLPIVALPTTLSGSEFSHYFGVTETSGAVKFKRELRDQGDSTAGRDNRPRANSGYAAVIAPFLRHQRDRPRCRRNAAGGTGPSARYSRGQWSPSFSERSRALAFGNRNPRCPRCEINHVR